MRSGWTIPFKLSIPSPGGSATQLTLCAPNIGRSSLRGLRCELGRRGCWLAAWPENLKHSYARRGRLAELVLNRLADARLVYIVEHVVAELRGICRLWHLKHQPNGSPLTAVYVRRRDPAPHQYQNRVVSIVSGISERERRSPHRYHLALATLIFDV